MTRTAAARKRRERERQQLRDEGFELLECAVDVQALERAQLLPPAATSDERAEQVGALLVLLATPRVAVAVRRELETILEGLAAEASPQMSQRDIELLASNEEDRKYDHGNE